MHPRAPLCAHCLLLLLLGACGNSADDTAAADVDMVTAATLGEQSLRSAAEYLTRAPFASANAALGERLLQQCKACHTTGAGGANTVGPNLYGLFGRRAGSVNGFDYSDALAGATFVWTPRALDAWLSRPDRFLPGNNMTFPGVPYADDRNALIALLLRQTSDNNN